MIIKEIEIKKFRAFENISFSLGKHITAIAGRNATQKTTVLGMIGQPFTISSKENEMYGSRTIDGYNFKSQFKEKFKISPIHDKIGDHNWTLKLHQNVYTDSSYTVESISRKQKGKPDTLRFWNAKSRAKGAGYIQLPVYYLSLSRLFPIGEVGKTKTIDIILNDKEKKYCIDNYRSILSIQDTGNSAIGLEKGAASKTFSGVSDQTHDIFTNSAGEGNVIRIILAVLSFKKLKEKYGQKYKGGLLLIDELDSTLYAFSQIKIVEYLKKAAEENKIQVVFTTHSPIVLKAVNRLQRKELQEKNTNFPSYAYNSSIVYLEPQYDSAGKRTIVSKNIASSYDLNSILNDINLSIPIDGNKINVYCEDARAVKFVQHLLKKRLNFNLERYMQFIDINLGWTNYLQLVDKKIPEFQKNLIILDNDVKCNKDYKKSKKKIVEEANNIIFLPLVIEKNIFIFLKNHSNFNEFLKDYCKVSSYKYDICFNYWPLDSDNYKAEDYKEWFMQLEKTLGEIDIVYDFWIKKNDMAFNQFCDEFIETFNRLADINEVDRIPIFNEEFKDVIE